LLFAKSEFLQISFHYNELIELTTINCTKAKALDSKASELESKALALDWLESKALALDWLESKALALDWLESKALALD